MTEVLNSHSGVNRAGDVVPIDDVDVIRFETRNIKPPILTGPLTAKQAAIDGLLVAHETSSRISAQANHPANSGDYAISAAETPLGEVAEALLAVYSNKFAELSSRGATEKRATSGPHYIKLMSGLTHSLLRGLVSKEEVNAVCAIVGPVDVRPEPVGEIIVPADLDVFVPKGPHKYDDIGKARAGDYSDRE